MHTQRIATTENKTTGHKFKPFNVQRPSRKIQWPAQSQAHAEAAMPRTAEAMASFYRTTYVCLPRKVSREHQF